MPDEKPKPLSANHQAIKEIVEDTVFNHKDQHGNSRFAREVHEAVFDGHGNDESRFQKELRTAFYGTIGKWFVGGGLVIILGLANIYFQVNNNTKQLEEGGRYTESDALEDLRIQESRDARQDEDIQNLRNEINQKLDRILESFIKPN